ncbi:MAG: DNA primase small subunit PriS [Candidatus Bathyarchaeia archaeon]
MGSAEDPDQLARSAVKSKFQEYYRKNSDSIFPPSSMEKREFGFLVFTEGVMIRHRSFRNVGDLRMFIQETAPSDVYYSAAYYEDPEAPMDKKGWSGSDLIFDIDADHIETPCKQTHDRWLCIGCRFSGRGRAPLNCPRCGGQKFQEEVWMCNECLERAKQEILKLIEFLSRDLGVDKDEIRVNFSGHRGYHLHVESEEVKSLSSEDRREIVDYVTGTGLEPELLGLLDTEGRLKVAGGPHPSDSGWRGRIARGIMQVLLRTDAFELREMGLKSNTIESLIRLRGEADAGTISWAEIDGAGRRTWQIIVRKAARLGAVSIDTVVTSDIHRLIRLPETLNGKTGLKAMHVKIEELATFSPLTQGIWTFRKR